MSILDRVYETGRRVAAGFQAAMWILFDTIVPGWNYRVIPGLNAGSY